MPACLPVNVERCLQASLREAIDQALGCTEGEVRGDVCYVQEWIEAVVEMRCFVLHGRLEHVSYTTWEEGFPDGVPRLGSISVQQANRLVGGEEARVSLEGEARQGMIPQLLRWLGGLDAGAGPLGFARFDFLVEKAEGIAPPSSRLRLIEVTEPGACAFDWATGEGQIQRAAVAAALLPPPAAREFE